MTTDPAQVLEDAADVLLVHGRAQHWGRSHDGAFCPLGAIAEVVHPGWDEVDSSYYFQAIKQRLVAREAVAALARRIADGTRPHYNSPEDNVWNWNDATPSDDEVLDTLLLAAKDLRG